MRINNKSLTVEDVQNHKVRLYILYWYNRHKNNTGENKNMARDIKNPVTGEYFTRSQAFLWHVKCKNAAASGGFYGDAIKYHQHILNDMIILEHAAMMN